MRFSELKNYFTIFFLGISSAIPLSLISSTLKIFLSERGLSLEFIGYLSLLSIPYSLKFLFAPFLDSFPIPILSKRIGQRKSWLVSLQIMVAALIIALGAISINNQIFLIFWVGLSLAFVSACQDVVIDGYRIELFDENSQALGASFYIYGYRIGLLISGALALFLADIIAWQLVYLIMAFFVLLCLIATIFAKESRPNWQHKKMRAGQWFHGFVVEPFIDFAKKPHWLAILAFILSFKLADSFAGNLTGVFLREIGFTKTELAAILKTFGLFATMIGVLAGGLLVKKFGTKNCLWIAIILQGISNLSFYFQASLGHNIEALYLVIFIENFSGGIGDAVFVAYLSKLCSKKFSATQYALLSSFASLSRSFLAAKAGTYASLLGWPNFFLLTIFLALPSLILMPFIASKSRT